MDVNNNNTAKKRYLHFAMIASDKDIIIDEPYTIVSCRAWTALTPACVGFFSSDPLCIAPEGAAGLAYQSALGRAGSRCKKTDTVPVTGITILTHSTTPPVVQQVEAQRWVLLIHVNTVVAQWAGTKWELRADVSYFESYNYERFYNAQIAKPADAYVGQSYAELLTLGWTP